ncbi:hypothetical protein H6P81_007639 [Aristolochia fimbriata]|uniref:Pectinesterase n=1 Tax=Aristolochia fimbriata TaxID=158543 RepID=A0AAV7F335_ARIFI|nr:hypothetical protein H6P81_007639 [Aristolochia fimbriata]
MDTFVVCFVSWFLVSAVWSVSGDQAHDHVSSSYCTHVPYPDLCSSLITTDDQVLTSSSSFDDAKSGFRGLALQATLARAEEAHRFLSAMDLGSVEEKGKVAWGDCLELMEDTVAQLKRSVSSMEVEDTQTWLSAATTNLQTCKDGFKDLNLSSILMSSGMMLPFMSSTGNFTKFLSNSLAINKAAALPAAPGGGLRRRLLSDGFPSWVSSKDRKLLQSPAPNANVVVAKDGSGNYRTISEAVAAAAKSGGGKRFVVRVKAGVYKENVEVKTANVMLVGDGMGSTIVTGSKNVQDGSTTFRSATFAVTGDGFLARDITFENTAGPQKHQAVALRSGSDRSIFFRCGFKGYQDTLYVYSQRQFYRDCDIYGTVDFIFGDAAAVIQNCNIYVRKPMSGQKNTVTAQGRSDPNENTGISVHNSRVAAAEGLGGVKSYLGRPWKEYSRTVFMKCNLGGLIDPAGWLEWSGNFALKTLYYGEYMNSGAGAATGGRVKWPGFRVMSGADAAKFTVGSFLGGGSWITSAGVPVASGL